MRNMIARRDFLRTTLALGAGIGLTGLADGRLLAAPPGGGAPHAEKLGWQLGCQAYTFNHFTFFEAVEKTASLGLRFIEAYPGQTLSKASPEVAVGPAMSPADRQEMKKKLADCGVKLVNYGVADSGRETFDFAKDMGVQTVVCEPPLDGFDQVERLCEEYGINLAIHNHPKPSFYWDYHTVLKACQGRSKRIGACADTGHWMRSGINPLEAIRALKGRIVSFHFKDLNEYAGDAHDVPWGTGKADVKALLTEIHHQGFKGTFSIEYEYHWLNSLPEIAQSVKYFDEVAAGLAATTADNELMAK
jgi:sugar phosphate isomerase/epimerase